MQYRPARGGGFNPDRHVRFDVIIEGFCCGRFVTDLDGFDDAAHEIHVLVPVQRVLLDDLILITSLTNTEEAKLVGEIDHGLRLFPQIGETPS